MALRNQGSELELQGFLLQLLIFLHLQNSFLTQAFTIHHEQNHLRTDVLQPTVFVFLKPFLLWTSKTYSFQERSPCERASSSLLMPSCISRHWNARESNSHLSHPSSKPTHAIHTSIPGLPDLNIPGPSQTSSLEDSEGFASAGFGPGFSPKAPGLVPTGKVHQSYFTENSNVAFKSLRWV